MTPEHLLKEGKRVMLFLRCRRHMLSQRGTGAKGRVRGRGWPAETQTGVRWPAEGREGGRHHGLPVARNVWCGIMQTRQPLPRPSPPPPPPLPLLLADCPSSCRPPTFLLLPSSFPAAITNTFPQAAAAAAACGPSPPPSLRISVITLIPNPVQLIVIYMTICLEAAPAEFSQKNKDL